jgi:hypothetical protein
VSVDVEPIKGSSQKRALVIAWPVIDVVSEDESVTVRGVALPVTVNVFEDTRFRVAAPAVDKVRDALPESLDSTAPPALDSTSSADPLLPHSVVTPVGPISTSPVVVPVFTSWMIPAADVRDIVSTPPFAYIPHEVADDEHTNWPARSVPAPVPRLMIRVGEASGSPE